MRSLLRSPWCLLSILLAACQSAPVQAPEPARCGPRVPENAEHPIARRPVALSGDYDLIQVRTQPTHGVSMGRLHLAPLDSTARARAAGGPVRDLLGWLDPTSGDTTARPDAGSRDPEHPGAVLAGTHLRLGQVGLDSGRFEQLSITAVSPDGFWGWWKAEPGWAVVVERDDGRVLPDPAGYFCALRVAPGR